jgi:hypothetical protein
MRRLRPHALKEAEAEGLHEVHVWAVDCQGTSETAAVWRMVAKGQWSY